MPSPQTQRPTRRAALRVGSLGLGLTLADYFRLRAGAADPGRPAREPKAQNVIQIFLSGGCAAQESLDPKPEAPVEYRGPFGVVKTRQAGVVFSETMPAAARVLDKVTVVRSVSGRIPDHGQAQYHMLTGYAPTPAIQHPAMGSVVGYKFGPRNDLPPFVGVPAAVSFAGSGYLSAKYGPFNVGADPAVPGFKVRDIALPVGLTAERFARRQAARGAVESHLRAAGADAGVLDTADEFYQRAYKLVASPAAQKAFSLDGESAATTDLYCGNFVNPKTRQQVLVGKRLLLARRLVEAGVRFVNVEIGGFDMHLTIREQMAALLPAVDHAFAGLVTDLDARGLLDSTLVVLVTEFGRSPKINIDAGRDHYARVFSAALAGGGTPRGLVYGASDATLSDVARDAVPVEDLLHTVYHLIGIDAEERLMAPGDRPIDIVRGGKLVKGLVA
ncbi:sulfatase : Uncharacterized protein OS=Solibacter usitatus (strain Ellin6076) GN=Acid_5041 PE=4 SV=1: DUF1501 [Gemmataceae bacterium]|nr:sulfatase : Uncharacterized protein OS=Solibacter usitatus (strain Ellin6076) GN=Acid_5041 PE=4 SV=1: DUF1501 [Gemmataceae bacterium]VTU01793.1 sulfatase : Uncharacterized protein OS=Solibacter usitatus (strain Ellin6076) GN=Acid_5041 PE=4 SV=1: DUF1501 [Gemmataceae bacterium]